VEYQSSIPISKAENILAHDPCRLNLSYKPTHLRPEVSSVLLAETLPGRGVWLTGESAGEDDVLVPPSGTPSSGKFSVNCVIVEGMYVFVMVGIRPVV